MEMTERQTRELKSRYIIIISFFFIMFNSSLEAANYVTVATIGSRVSEVDKSNGMQEVVEQVKKFWHRKLEQVLLDKPDLIVLPEYCDFARGLTKEEEKEYLQIRKDQIIEFFSSEAISNNCYIAFGMKREMKDGSWRNSCIIINRGGKIEGIYDKYFPTEEDIKSGVKAGTEVSLIQCDFGSIGCAICFDLNFENVRQVYENFKPDIIIFPSMYHGGIMQSYWAYSCHSFFISAITGENPSEVRNPLGEIIASSTNYFDFTVTTINLDSRLVHLDGNWEKLTKLKKKYGRRVKIKDPGKLGVILVSSEDENMTIDNMLKEFNIELLDDYFKRALKFRNRPDN